MTFKSGWCANYVMLHLLLDKLNYFFLNVLKFTACAFDVMSYLLRRCVCQILSMNNTILVIKKITFSINVYHLLFL